MLHRYSEDQNMMVFGEPFLPYFIDEDIDNLNQSLLLKLLNEGNVFDDEINTAERDRLQLSFQIEKNLSQSLNYGFEFREGRWKKYPFDILDWMKKHEQEMYGKIMNAIKRVPKE